jgi:glycerol-3-phosphate O-acyltransferase 3/4
LVQTLASAFVASWSSVVRFHGLRPRPRPGHSAGVFVSNHSSMIDFILLVQSHPYAVVGQKHTGWVGFLQDTMLSSLNCVWFDRGESKDKKAAAERLKTHVRDPSNLDTPALVFPEGTCVNNEYVIQFKKFVFELGVPINPIAIKYNKVFVDGYWNSRAESFALHLYRLMTSWALVVDVWFLDPQTRAPGESGAAFSQRVQRMIAARAGLKAMDWDGYMKYWRPSPKFMSACQRNVADDLCAALGIRDAPEGLAVGSPYERFEPISSSASSADCSVASTRHSSMSELGGATPLAPLELAALELQEGKKSSVSASPKFMIGEECQ